MENIQNTLKNVNAGLKPFIEGRKQKIIWILKTPLRSTCLAMLLKPWKEEYDNSGFKGTILTDFSKVFETERKN